VARAFITLGKIVKSAFVAGPDQRATQRLSFLSSKRLNKNCSCAIWRIFPERRANVAVLAGLMMPVFLGASGLGVEASNWGVLQNELQRTADAGVIAAALVYQTTANAQTAANAAADLVELNGVTGATSRTWNSSTNTLTDNLITVKKVTGIRSSSDTAFEVTIQQSFPLAIAKLFVTGDSVTIASGSWSELVSAASTQPCIAALGTTSTAVYVTGSATISGAHCAVRSNGGVSLTGSASITAASVVAANSITTTGSAAVHATETPSDGTITDPYANYSPVQNLIKDLSAGSGSAESVGNSNTATIGPGTYSSISVSGSATLTMQPGLYVVNGNISWGNSGVISAAGVTIVSSGTLTVSGSAKVTLSAPGTTPTGSAVSGVAYVSTTTGATSFGGSGTMLLTGVFYTPNSAMTVSGSASYGADDCLELVAKTVTVTGSGTIGGGCSTLGAISFGSTNATTIALVQ
jgi:hypothetical protein